MNKTKILSLLTLVLMTNSALAQVSNVGVPAQPIPLKTNIVPQNAMPTPQNGVVDSAIISNIQIQQETEATLKDLFKKRNAKTLLEADLANKKIELELKETEAKLNNVAAFGVNGIVKDNKTNPNDIQITNPSPLVPGLNMLPTKGVPVATEDLNNDTITISSIYYAENSYTVELKINGLKNVATVGDTLTNNAKVINISKSNVTLKKGNKTVVYKIAGQK